MSCLIGGTVEPILFRNTLNTGTLNKTCIMERHKKLHGGVFLPQAKEECSSFVKLNDITQHSIMEVDSFFDLKFHVDNLQPFVLRSQTSLTSKWDDDYFAQKHSNNAKKEVDLKECNQTNKRKKYINGPVPASLMQDVILLPELSRESFLKTLDKTTFWYSADSKHESNLHRDPGLFFIHQIAGKKRISLIDPDFSLHLYADFGDTYNLSPINPSNIDVSLYPKILDVTIQSTTLNEGDVCFLPYMYWHFVEGIPGINTTERNVALTYQFSADEKHACHKFSENEVRKCIHAWRRKSNVVLGKKIHNVSLSDILQPSRQ